MQQYLGASRGVFDTVIVWMDIHSEGGLSHPTIHQGTALDLLHRAPWIYCTERPGFIAQRAQFTKIQGTGAQIAQYCIGKY